MLFHLHSIFRSVLSKSFSILDPPQGWRIGGPRGEMLPPLGLFSSASCPDRFCRRPHCFFSHFKIPLAADDPSPHSPAQTAVKRKVEPNASNSTPKRKVAQNGESQAKPSSPSASQTTSRARVNQAASSSKPPSLPPSTKLSPQPIMDRQKALQTLFTQFQSLYSSILSQSPKLASESAKAQESDISSSCSNLRAYKTAIHHAAVSISRRPPPDTIPHPSIGTLRESRAAYQAAEKESEGRLTRNRVSKYCLSREQMATWEYPDLDEPALTVDNATEPSLEGSTRTCDRCKTTFVVSAQNLKERFGECRFHHGRLAPQRIEGRRKWIYSCCSRERGEVGCEEGVHVVSDGADDKKLASRMPFKSVHHVLHGKKSSAATLEVVGIDCEMIYTCAGISVGRITLVDDKGNTVLDELIRQTVPVLDVNTRFSGIQQKELDEAIIDLPSAREAVCAFVGEETVIVGHGLENDLRAMRLLHDRLIDTAILFPHDKGAPYRRALRDLVKETLGYFIQERTADEGHSSEVDAKATLELLRWKVREDFKDG